MKSQHTGFYRIIAAFGNSFAGLKSVFKSEQAFRQDLIICIIEIVILCLFSFTSIERLFVIGSLFAIIFMELINTAIETTVDRIGPEYNVLSKKAKDIGSLLVLLAFIYNICCWMIVLL
jgi:diacylglycerol kinase (ATP)